MNFVKVVVIRNLTFHETQLGYFERACCRNVRCQGQNVDSVIHAIKKIATAAWSVMSSTLSLQHELPYLLVCGVCSRSGFSLTLVVRDFRTTYSFIVSIYYPNMNDMRGYFCEISGLEAKNVFEYREQLDIASFVHARRT